MPSNAVQPSNQSDVIANQRFVEDACTNLTCSFQLLCDNLQQIQVRLLATHTLFILPAD